MRGGKFRRICLERNVLEKQMKKVIALVLIALAVTSCTQTEKGATIGAAGGAIIGGAVSNNFGGALVGAAIGGVAGALIGQASEPGQCYYRDRYGRRYVAACPSGRRHHRRY
jgi:hypothetical protein